MSGIPKTFSKMALTARLFLDLDNADYIYRLRHGLYDGRFETTLLGVNCEVQIVLKGL